MNWLRRGRRIKELEAEVGDLRRAGEHLHQATDDAYKSSRKSGEPLSLGQKDGLFYALRHWRSI